MTTPMEVRTPTGTRTLTGTPTITATIMTRALLRAQPRKRGPGQGAGKPVSRVPAVGPAKSAAADHAALYRLMAWLSPAYPVGAFSYSGGIEWAVEAGDIVDAATLRQWLAVLIADGSGFCDAVFFVQAHRAITGDDDAAAAGRSGACGGLRAVEGALSGNHRAGPRLSRHNRRGVAMRRAFAVFAGLDRPGRAAGRGRGRLCRSRHRLRSGPARVPARACRELDFRRRAAHSARADRRPARARGPRIRRLPPLPHAR